MGFQQPPAASPVQQQDAASASHAHRDRCKLLPGHRNKKLLALSVSEGLQRVQGAWDEVRLPRPCCFWSCKPLGPRLKTRRMNAACVLLRHPEWLLKGRFCFPWLSVSMAICLGAPLWREHPHGMHLGWGSRDTRVSRQAVLAGRRSGKLLAGLASKSWGKSTDLDFIIQLPNRCFSVVLVGFTAPCSPPAPAGLVSPPHISPGRWGDALTSRS